MSRVWIPDNEAGTFMSFSISDSGYLAYGFETGEIKVVNFEDFSVIDEVYSKSQVFINSLTFINLIN